jgi:hypothetical protein
MSNLAKSWGRKLNQRQYIVAPAVLPGYLGRGKPGHAESCQALGKRRTMHWGELSDFAVREHEN